MEVLKNNILIQENTGKMLDLDILNEKTKQTEMIEKTNQEIEKTEQLELKIEKTKQLELQFFNFLENLGFCRKLKKY